MRAASLRNYSGHAAFPGGKADDLSETPWETSRREAFEEIGLPMDDSKLPKPFRIEHICELPFNLAKTELAVRPCVAFLHADGVANPAESLIPRLDQNEVAAVFSASFHNFLKDEDEVGEGEVPPPGQWYQGEWTKFHDDKWKMHRFLVPVNNQVVSRPKSFDLGKEPSSSRFLVWGFTARVLVDAARLAYGEDPSFEVCSTPKTTLDSTDDLIA